MANTVGHCIFTLHVPVRLESNSIQRSRTEKQAHFFQKDICNRQVIQLYLQLICIFFYLPPREVKELIIISKNEMVAVQNMLNIYYKHWWCPANTTTADLDLKYLFKEQIKTTICFVTKTRDTGSPSVNDRKVFTRQRSSIYFFYSSKNIE